jgi:methyl-accepting chemotaxis protein
MSLADFKVGTRLGVGFSLVLALIVLLVVMGLSRMAQVKDNLENIVKHNIAGINHVSAIREAIASSAISARDMVLLPDQNDIATEAGRIEQAQHDYDEHFSALTALMKNETSKLLLARIQDEYGEFSRHMDKSIQLIKDNQRPEATRILREQALPSQRLLMDSLNEMSALQEKQSTASMELASLAYSNTRTLAISMTLAALALGAFIAWTNTRSITRPLRQAVELASAVARGDLTQRIEVKTRDEIGQLMHALQGMNRGLAGIVGGVLGEVRNSIDTISTTAQQIAAGNSDLSQRTEKQALSLEETAASMEQMTEMVKQNAENARQANWLAVNASDIAVKGGHAVGEVVQTMASITDSSKKIADIIGVIESIAFQTNILALNAAVEAARAGKQGSSFAVVAGEVRHLAQRSAAAAKEIKALIGDSVEKVSTGSTQVNHAGATMIEIVAAIKRVTDIMSEISVASSEQSTGIEQVNKAIIRMGKVTQQNAALVEEAATAAESMLKQAENLSAAVSAFKLEAARTHTPADTPKILAIKNMPARMVAKPARLATEKRTRAGVAKPAVLAMPGYGIL